MMMMVIIIMKIAQRASELVVLEVAHEAEEGWVLEGPCVFLVELLEHCSQLITVHIPAQHMQETPNLVEVQTPALVDIEVVEDLLEFIVLFFEEAKIKRLLQLPPVLVSF